MTPDCPPSHAMVDESPGMHLNPVKGGTKYGLQIIDPTEKDTWPVVGDQSKQFCRTQCCCCQSGFSGNVIPKLTKPKNAVIVQLFCLRAKSPASLTKKFGTEIVQEYKCWEKDVNICHNHCACCDGGIMKFEKVCQCYCLKYTAE
eukprot:CAMPEP_0175130566 /NCGR_PEP_ID=MMETSP0087-20121206/6074_1 /TAXON_ID=136419 /ORGANISM="Unknown Unknown, Strain D1" /LENGTH=144 /DNA_ID=CAMNT_0016412791 /DNA_START=16 /DNA_END=450 /DNA_ORIENTATION=+